jgi:hypothetical protein
MRRRGQTDGQMDDRILKVSIKLTRAETRNGHSIVMSVGDSDRVVISLARYSSRLLFIFVVSLR